MPTTTTWWFDSLWERGGFGWGQAMPGEAVKQSGVGGLQTKKKKKRKKKKRHWRGSSSSWARVGWAARTRPTHYRRHDEQLPSLSYRQCLPAQYGVLRTLYRITCISLPGRRWSRQDRSPPAHGAPYLRWASWSFARLPSLVMELPFVGCVSRPCSQ